MRSHRIIGEPEFGAVPRPVPTAKDLTTVPPVLANWTQGPAAVSIELKGTYHSDYVADGVIDTIVAHRTPGSERRHSPSTGIEKRERRHTGTLVAIARGAFRLLRTLPMGYLKYR